MPFICPACGEQHTFEEVEFSIAALPDVIESLPEEERSWRVEEDEHRAVLDGRRFFVRAAIPVPVEGVREPFYVGTWTEVSAHTFQRAGSEEVAEEHFPGTLATEILLLGLPAGLEVNLTALAPGRVAILRAASTEDQFSRMRARGLPLSEVSRLFHAFMLEEDVDREEQFAQVQRRLVLQRFLEEVREQFEQQVPPPPEGAELPSLVGMLIPIQLGGASGPVFLGGESVEGILSGADQEMRSREGGGEKWGLTIWALDEERVIFTRLYQESGAREDSAPLPALLLLARLLAGRGGYLCLIQRQSGELEPVAGVILPPDSPRLEMLKEAASGLALLEHAAAGFRGESEQGEEMWGSSGVGALEVAEVARELYQSWIRDGLSGQMLGTSEESARERLALRLRQIELLFQVGIPILQEGEQTGSYTAAALETAEALALRLEEMNQRLGAHADFSLIAQEMIEESEAPSEVS